MNRRSFIGSILALGVAPAIVRADSLMRIVQRDALIVGVSASDLLTMNTGARMRPGDVFSFSGLLGMDNVQKHEWRVIAVTDDSEYGSRVEAVQHQREVYAQPFKFNDTDAISLSWKRADSPHLTLQNQ